MSPFLIYLHLFIWYNAIVDGGVDEVVVMYMKFHWFCKFLIYFTAKNHNS